MKAAGSFILLAAIAGALIGLTRLATYQAIADNEANARAAIIADMLPSNPDPGAADRLCASEVRGYAGTVRLLVLPESMRTTKQNKQMTIAAVRVVAHSETPGIGDFIELDNSDWILGFNGLPVYAEFDATVTEMQQRLDAVTGATVTRRAIINGVANACLI